ncbi:MAG: 30S ribosomal protein S12 methylthiotransferase RimO [Clostridia bacterium]|nr:30S ribosomal protein S12 methylthiotransferase RimO [Clostridia bacterium]
MAIKVGMVYLGCEKNRIDGEILMSKLKDAGYELSDDPALADVAIVNTCGFIESAKRESIDEILELGRLKQEGQIRKIIVTGCLAERYLEEVEKELPEVDGVIGIGANEEIVPLFERILSGERAVVKKDKTLLPIEGERELSTPSYFAYLKIAEGCDNRCTYCAIPSIRGPFRSRTVESILEEAQALVKQGAKELILIAQDTSRYGIDLYGEYKLSDLLHKLCAIEPLRWIRLLYCYPDCLSDELIDTIASEDKIVKYIDIPLQHASGSVLKRMNRRGDASSLEKLMNKLRERIPGVTLRTTVMVGFPGETEDDFEVLMNFIRKVRFERLGCFSYSREEGTPAYSLPSQVSEEEKERREELVSETQMLIMQEKGEAMIGKTVTVLTEGFDRWAECYFGRTQGDAPEIDGKVFFTAPEKKPVYGQFVQVRIDDCMDCDLIGEMILQED